LCLFHLRKHITNIVMVYSLNKITQSNNFLKLSVYYYEMSGQMKTLIDRLNPMYSKDYRFRDVYLLATAAEEGDEVFEKVITGLNGWIDCFEKTSIKGTVLCGGVSSGGDISSNDKLKEAYNLGSHV
uniref:flavodoxin family protein n=1 Tax=Catenibacterium mitsuokai TaxID=100886 RepID=UPI003FEF9F9E